MTQPLAADIVRQLQEALEDIRNHSKPPFTGEQWHVYNLEGAEAALNLIPQLLAKIELVQEKNKRLREALTSIANNPYAHSEDANCAKHAINWAKE